MDTKYTEEMKNFTGMTPSLTRMTKLYKVHILITSIFPPTLNTIVFRQRI